MEGKGRRQIGTVTLFCGLVVLAVSCATIERAYHGSIMKGSIIDKEDSIVYLCIGKKDGAKVGQELDVYRMKVVRTATKPQTTETERHLVGKVRISEVVDEHFARAAITSGSAEKNDIAALGW